MILSKLCFFCIITLSPFSVNHRFRVPKNGPLPRGPPRALCSKINYHFIQPRFFLHTFLYIYPLLVNYLFMFPKKWAPQRLPPGPLFLNPPLAVNHPVQSLRCILFLTQLYYCGRLNNTRESVTGIMTIFLINEVSGIPYILFNL